MKRITDIFAQAERTFSVEFFPPKDERGHERLYEAAAEFARLGVDFFSVTYGAGGSSNTATLAVARELQRRFGLPVVHHLTCVRHTRDDLRAVLRRIKEAGVCNILAMRGDPPRDEPDYRPGPDEPRFGWELVRLCREPEFGPWFSVGVPGFPEGHTQTPSLQLDSRYLKVKQDEGAQYVITQLFLNNAMYYDYVSRCRQAGVTIRLIPGILPISDYGRLVKFCRTCGATIPKSTHEAFAPIADDPQATRAKGLEVVTRQCRDLLANAAPGLHLFSLNRLEPAATILRAVVGSPKAAAR